GGVADGVDATVEPQESPGSKPVGDRTRPEPERPQLRAADDTGLASREPRHRRAHVNNVVCPLRDEGITTKWMRVIQNVVSPGPGAGVYDETALPRMVPPSLAPFAPGKRIRTTFEQS